MNTRTYQRFIPQENNTNDVIQAEDINELQRAIEKLQEDSFVQGDVGFLNKSVVALEHHPDANAMIVDLLEDSSKLDLSKGVGVFYDEQSKSLGLEDGVLNGSIVTKMITNETGKAFTKLVLLADEYKPVNTVISYEISYDDIVYTAITANQAIPLVIADAQPQFFLRITFDRIDVLGESPRLDAWTLLYQDQTYSFTFMEDGLSITP